MGGEVGGGLKTSAGVWVTVPQKKMTKMKVRTEQKVKVEMKVGIYLVVGGAWWVR